MEEGERQERKGKGGERFSSFIICPFVMNVFFSLVGELLKFNQNLHPHNHQYWNYTE